MSELEIVRPKRRFEDHELNDERMHYQKIVSTFAAYQKYSCAKLHRTTTYLESLSKRHQELLKDYKTHVQSLRDCVAKNQEIFDLVMGEESNMFENHEDIYPKEVQNTLPKMQPSAFDFDKLTAVLKQIFHEWSSEGEEGRDSCYRIIVEELERQFSTIKTKTDVRVLLPGAGLGRLAWEVVRRGYVTEGNEFSLFMLFTSNWILNKCYGKNLYKVYPFIHQLTNNLRHEDQVRPISFPDIDPSDLPVNTRFSMTAGDFLDVYGTPENQEAWDSIITCFFIDCASNVVSFFERIHGCLKQGGVWINLGPLLYHYADMPDEPSIEPSFDFLVDIIRKIGFSIEKQLEHVPTHYAENPRSMLRYTYKSVFLVCRKL